MSKEKSTIKKGITKSTDYPVIYSYIYERETNDILRLSDNFKNVRIKQKKTFQASKAILGFKVENGKVIPIYEDTENTSKVVAKRISSQRKTKARLKNPRIARVVKKNTKKNNDTDSESK